MAGRIAALPSGRGESRAIEEAWLDGSPWKLYRGADFERTTSAMRAALSATGRARGLRLRSRTGREEDGTETLSVVFVPADKGGEGSAVEREG